MDEINEVPESSECSIDEQVNKKDDSMEQLRVDDEIESDITVQENEVKETSAEDLLGKQSLLYSGSESDENLAEPKTIIRKSLKRIVDSEDEDMESIKPNLPKTKMLNTIDSDSEAEDSTMNHKTSHNRLEVIEDITQEKELKTTIQEGQYSIQKNSDNLEGDLKKNEARKSKISSLIDSDSESESDSNLPKSWKKSNKSSQESKSKNRWKNKLKEQEMKKKSKILSPYEFESDSDNQLSSNSVSKSKKDISNNKKKRKELKNKSHNTSHSETDSDSQMSANENNNLLRDSNDEDLISTGTDEKTKQKPMRASAKKALDEMQAIQSEQQRLHREAHISIPYHKPKRYSLQEFLKRHTIIKPHQEGEVSTLSNIVRSKSLKMNAEELEEYAKLMEERAKEATEFFKSESDDEILKDNSLINYNESDDSKKIEKNELPNFTDIGINSIETDVLNKDVNSESLDIARMSQENSLNENLDNSGSNLIVTEVIELPKIDINSLHLTPASLITPENIKRIIHEKKLTESPSLQGDKNMLIDLETGDLMVKKPTGVDNLLKRFLAAKASKKQKTTETLSILSTENGKIEISKVSINIADESETVEQKPGASYFKLKENLRSIITQKRQEELEKKKAEKREEELEHNKCLDDDEEEEEYEDEEEETNNETLSNLEIDNEENLVNVFDDEAIEAENNIDEENEELIDEENEEVNDENDENQKAKITEKSSGAREHKYDDNNEDNSKRVDENKCKENTDQSSDSESDNDSEESVTDVTIDNSKRKNRIIKAFQDDSDDEVDLLKTPSTQAIMSLRTDKLFNEDKTKNQSDEENELLGLCSGQFNATEQTQRHALISQIPTTQVISGADAADELLELCSGNFEENGTANAKQPSDLPTLEAPVCNKILSSGEENSINIGNSSEMKTRIRKLTKRMKKKNAKLGFSDDEYDNESSDEIESELEDEEEAPETYVDYDSEENEILVQMTKKDCVKEAQNFFEKEAELSESEWGSADEDEKNLDKYDIELGDEDEFDREKLRTELGQIHARKMLDEDIREVRKIQEMFFEDEEKDGVGRQRQFRWKNAESGFSLEDPNVTDNINGENQDEIDDENEHLWRKIRYEREQILKEQALKENSQDVTTTTILTDSTLSATLTGNNTNSGLTKKLNLITAKKTITSVEVKQSSPFLISKGVATANRKTVRGSFLVRDKDTLIKLAGLTKSGVNDTNGAAGTVSVKDVKPQNFVFATLTEEEHTNLKRKSEDVLNSSSEKGINFVKKPKTESRRGKCFIDQLL